MLSLPALIPGQVTMLADRLASLPAQLESAFLVTGERLEEVAEVSGQVTRVCATAGSLLADERIVPVIERLKGVLDRVERFFEMSAEERDDIFASLLGMEQVVLEADQGLSLFADKVKRLETLRLYTRIQTALHASGNSGFENVAGEISLLVGRIKAKNAEIAGDVTRLQTEIRETDTLFKEVRVRQQSVAAEAVRDIRSCVDELLELNRSRGRMMGDMDASMAALPRDICEIVAGLQFHDIARQKMEHVARALNTMGGGLQQGAGSGQGAADAGAEWLQVCELQLAQLRQARSDLQTAIAGLSGRLEGVSSGVSIIVSTMEALLGLSGDQHESHFARIATAFAQVKQALTTSRTLHETTVHRMTRVVELIEHGVAGIGVIETIGEDIRLIALNAMIKSVQAGDHGAALTVIAQAIKAEAEVLTVVIGDIVGSLGSLAEAASMLGGGAHRLAPHDQQAGVQAELEELEELLGTISSTGSGIDSHITAVAGSVQALREGVAASRESLKSAPGLAELDSGVIVPLEEVRDMLTFICRGKSSVQGDMAGSLSSHYTMSSEREIHDAIVSGQGIDSGMSAAEQASGTTNKDAEYDNVFLF